MTTPNTSITQQTRRQDSSSDTMWCCKVRTQKPLHSPLGWWNWWTRRRQRDIHVECGWSLKVWDIHTEIHEFSSFPLRFFHVRASDHLSIFNWITGTDCTTCRMCRIPPVQPSLFDEVTTSPFASVGQGLHCVETLSECVIVIVIVIVIVKKQPRQLQTRWNKLESWTSELYSEKFQTTKSNLRQLEQQQQLETVPETSWKNRKQHSKA